ncbi:hypothetical protein [Arenicella xantha]|nr:hypothetical protein [Arenicella xantha]
MRRKILMFFKSMLVMVPLVWSMACTYNELVAENSKLAFTSSIPMPGTYGAVECSKGFEAGTIKSASRRFYVCFEPIPNDILIEALPKYKIYLSVFENGTARLCDELVPYQVELSIGILSHHIVAEECYP